MKHVFACLFIFFTLFSTPAFPSAAPALTNFNNQLIQLANALHEAPVKLETVSDPMLQELEKLVKELKRRKMPKNFQEYEDCSPFKPFAFQGGERCFNVYFGDNTGRINQLLRDLIRRVEESSFLNDDLFDKSLVLDGFPASLESDRLFPLANLKSQERELYEDKSQQIKGQIAAKKRWYKTYFKAMDDRVSKLAVFLTDYLTQVKNLRDGRNDETLMNYEVSLNNLILFLENWRLAQRFLSQSEIVAPHEKFYENFLMGDFVVQEILETYSKEEKNAYHLDNPFDVIKAIIDNKEVASSFTLIGFRDAFFNKFMIEKIRKIVKSQGTPTMDKAHCEIIKSWNNRVQIPYFSNISDLPQCASV